MSDANIDINIRTTGAAEASTDVMQVGAKVEQLGEKSKTSTAPMRNMGMAANAVSYQLQDFTVQVGAGQSAITAFAQQAPQLIGGLQMAGVMTGTLSMAMAGLAVVIPIVLMGGRALAQHFQSANDAIKITPELIAATARNAAELEKIRFDEQRESIDAEIASMKALRNDFDLTRQADNEFAKASLTNAEATHKAWDNLLVSLGYRLDTMQEIALLAEAEERQRALAAQQAIADENRKAELAARAASDAEFELSQKEALAIQQKATLEFDRAKLALLEKEKSELEKIAKLKVAPGESGSWAPKPEGWTDAREPAKRKLETSRYNAEIASLKETVYILDAADRTNAKDLAKLTDALTIAENKKADTLAAAAENIARIGDTKAAQDLLAQSNTVKASTQQMAEDIDAHLATITPITEGAKGNIETLKKITADHQVTADELPKVAANLNELLSAVRSGFATTTETTAATAQWMTSANRHMQSLKAMILDLQSQMTQQRR